jgi:ABC-type Zn uptake system ZnuABC Zn-binding protein ZnuA
MVLAMSLLAIVPLLVACAQANAQQAPIQVVATIAPLADWAEQVGRERVNVTLIVPPGVDPEGYMVTDQDRQAIAEADVLISNGLGLEPWLEELAPTLAQQNLISLELAQFLRPAPVRQRPQPRNQQHDEDLEAGILRPQMTRAPASQVHSRFLWLDPGPDKAQLTVLLIRDTFTRVDPEHIMFYRRNAERYNGDLENLDTWIRRQVQEWPTVRVGSRHFRAMQGPDRSWHYFAQRYGIHLRTNIELKSMNPVLPASTALFVNEFVSPEEQYQAYGLRQPDGILNPFSPGEYIEMMRANVKIMTHGMREAARTAPRHTMSPIDE